VNLKQKDQPEEMKKEKSPVSSNDKKDLVSKLSRLSIDNNVFEGSTDLPQVFQVQFSDLSNRRFKTFPNILILIIILSAPIKSGYHTV